MSDLSLFGYETSIVYEYAGTKNGKVLYTMTYINKIQVNSNGKGAMLYLSNNPVIGFEEVHPNTPEYDRLKSLSSCTKRFNDMVTYSGCDTTDCDSFYGKHYNVHIFKELDLRYLKRTFPDYFSIRSDELMSDLKENKLSSQYLVVVLVHESTESMVRLTLDGNNPNLAIQHEKVHTRRVQKYDQFGIISADLDVALSECELSKFGFIRPFQVPSLDVIEECIPRINRRPYIKAKQMIQQYDVVVTYKGPNEYIARSRITHQNREYIVYELNFHSQCNADITFRI